MKIVIDFKITLKTSGILLTNRPANFASKMDFFYIVVADKLYQGNFQTAFSCFQKSQLTSVMAVKVLSTTRVKSPYEL